MSISVLCFSKDRPLQLEAYLRSLFGTSGEQLRTTVLYATETPYEEGYAELGKLFPHVTFVRETDFRAQTWEILKSVRGDYFMFGCDDVFFKRSWSTCDVLSAFEKHEELFGFSLRLGREITFSQPNDAPSVPPEFLLDAPFLLWNWREPGRMDWSLPFELNCTIYRVELVMEILSALDRLNRDWGNPNRLEIYTIPVSRAVKELNLMAAYPDARANCLTINRVEADVIYPIFGEENLTVDRLWTLWKDGFRLDTEKYRDRSYKSIHIGEAFFTKARAA